MSPVSYYESEVEFEPERAFDDSFEFKGKKAGTEQAKEVLSHLISTKNVKDETIIESCLRIPSFAANVSSSIVSGCFIVSKKGFSVRPSHQNQKSEN